MDYIGLAVIIRNEKEFNRLKDFLGSDILCVDYVPKMSRIETAVVIFTNADSYFSTGSIGSAAYQKESKLRLIEFKDFFK